MRDPRLEKLADVLVNYSTGVKKDWIVQISSPAVGIPLVVEVYRQVVKAGAHPHVAISVEELKEIFFQQASDAQIEYVSPLRKYEVETIDCHIGLWAEENTKSMTGIDAKKVARNAAARKPISEVFMKRAAEGKLRWVGTEYPTQASAQDAEMSLADYERFVFSAGKLHEPDPAAAWRKQGESQQRLADFLNGKRDYRVTAANGTDVRMSVADRRWINCDGHENFPDGEVFTGPVLDSVNGVIAYSFPAVHMGREVDGVRLTFRDGKVVDAHADKGEDFLIAMLDTDAGARFLGECAIGTNYGITRYVKNTLFDEKIGGTVHFAVGAGYPETGNTNESGLHWDMVVDLRKGGRITIDGQTVSENGKFTREDWPR